MAFFLVPFILLLLIFVSFLGPGLVLTRGLRVAPAERLTLSVGLSGIILYLVAFAIYAFDLPLVSHWGVSIACIIAFLFSIGEGRKLFADRSLRILWQVLLFVAFWVALHLLIVRNFSGGGWYGDWFEHYQRALFFLLRPPLDVPLLGIYWLPARPPLVNVLTSHFLTVVSPAFPLYQIATASMGLLVCLPLLLFARHAEQNPARVVPLLVFLLALNPLFLQNAAFFPWTRHFTNFYILSGLYFYWRGFCEDQMLKIGFSLLFFAAAILAHYSAGPYAVCVLGHLFLRLGLRRFLREQSLILFGFGSIFFMLTWFGWSLLHFGVALTFGSNTTALAAQGSTWADFAGKFFYNLWSTLVPHWFRAVKVALIDQDLGWGYLRDSTFLVVQTNLIAAIGLSGGLLLLTQVGSEIYRGNYRDPAWRFWAGLSVMMILLSIAVNPEADGFGIAHVCLQPVVLAGLVRLSVVTWERGPLFRSLLGLGAFAGYGLGILLHFLILSLSFVGSEDMLAQLSIRTRGNWLLKTDHNLTFLGDVAADYQNLFVTVEITTALLLCLGFVLWCVRSSARQRPHAVVSGGAG